jgi:hypothetical protein
MLESAVHEGVGLSFVKSFSFVKRQSQHHHQPRASHHVDCTAVASRILALAFVGLSAHFRFRV